MMTNLPNIIIFNPDQWRADVMGHLGNPAASTPNLDRAVQEDMVSFLNTFCQNPVCTPSRCSFMTGWYPHTRGHRTMYHMLKPDEPMLLKTLKEAGYRVWWGGKNDVVPAQNGYEQYCDVKYQAANTLERPLRPNLHVEQSWRGEKGSDNYYSFYAGCIPKADDELYVYDHDWAMVEGAAAEIRNAKDDQPLCIYLPLSYPHPPYGVENPWYSRIDRDLIPARTPAPADWSAKPSILKAIADNQGLHDWAEEQWTELRATYYGMCARVDYQFGLIVDALRDAGIYDETAIFFFSDHGDFTGDYGLVEKTQNTFEDCLTNVPFLIKLPAQYPAKPGVRDALVELIDFPATVEAITGIGPYHTHFGRSLLPVLLGETDQHRDAVFCQGGRLAVEQHAKELESSSSVNMADPTVSLYWPRLIVQQGDGPEHTKAVMCRTKDYKYIYRLYEQDELYDLKTDPREQVNRITDPDLRAIQTELRNRVLQFLVETSDCVPWQPDQRS